MLVKAVSVSGAEAVVGRQLKQQRCLCCAADDCSATGRVSVNVSMNAARIRTRWTAMHDSLSVAVVRGWSHG